MILIQTQKVEIQKSDDANLGFIVEKGRDRWVQKQGRKRSFKTEGGRGKTRDRVSLIRG